MFTLGEYLFSHCLRVRPNVLSSSSARHTYLIPLIVSAHRLLLINPYAFSLKHMPTVPIVGMGKEGRTLIGPWGYLNRKLPFIELP